MTINKSVAFFDEQFQRQLKEAAPKLNPFEELALPWLTGDVLDFGCGLGNLALAAAANDCRVDALDGSPVAIADLQARATEANLSVTATLADLRRYPVSREYDCVVSIGLLMFFDRETAFRVLVELQSHVRPGGILVINVLIEGTTYFDMFDPDGYCLFDHTVLMKEFADWELLRSELSDFDAPGQTIKRFLTLVAHKPGH